MSAKIKALLELAKVKITIAVSFTTITGFVLYNKGFSISMLLPTLGLFFLACGSSVINHIQENKTDSKMKRTMNRPLPSGKITVQEAWKFAILLNLSGFLLLYYYSSLIGLILGAIALLWYNLVYTYLKRVTYYAVIPGSLIGAIPPMVGWVTAGGSLSDSRAIVIAYFFFVWQVPHFWLLMLKFGEQYQNAGFPSITIKSQKIIKLMTFVWTITTALSALLLPFYLVVESNISVYGIVIASVWLIYQFIVLLGKNNEFTPGKYFMKINYYVLMMILILISDHWFLKIT